MILTTSFYFGCDAHLFAFRMFPIELCRNKSSLTPVSTINGTTLCCTQMAVTAIRKYIKCSNFQNVFVNDLSFILHLQNIKNQNCKRLSTKPQQCPRSLIWRKTTFLGRKQMSYFCQNLKKWIPWPQKHTNKL